MSNQENEELLASFAKNLAFPSDVGRPTNITHRLTNITQYICENQCNPRDVYQNKKPFRVEGFLSITGV
jgi:hypothetical protein